MEFFMIHTGFYEVATRKEAERRALAQWAREEHARLRKERREKTESRQLDQRLDSGHSPFYETLDLCLIFGYTTLSDWTIFVFCSTERENLLQNLENLREQEKSKGLRLDAEKLEIKAKLKILPSQ